MLVSVFLVVCLLLSGQAFAVGVIRNWCAASGGESVRRAECMLADDMAEQEGDSVEIYPEPEDLESGGLDLRAVISNLLRPPDMDGLGGGVGEIYPEPEDLRAVMVETSVGMLSVETPSEPIALNESGLGRGNVAEVGLSAFLQECLIMA